MVIKNYSLLKGQVINFLRSEHSELTDNHMEILVKGDGKSWRIANNVLSSMVPTELLFHEEKGFKPPFLNDLSALDTGLHTIDHQLAHLAIDYTSGRFISREAMIETSENQLLEKLEGLLARARDDNSASIYALGEAWGPEVDNKAWSADELRRIARVDDDGADYYFGFTPARGIHLIHMNQGYSGEEAAKNGRNQDGLLLINFRDTEDWLALFFAFQTQSWHNDDHGNPLP